jgi:hypothetical protein
MCNCWNRDPVIRPAFLEIMTRLATGANLAKSEGGPQERDGGTHTNNRYRRHEHGERILVHLEGHVAWLGLDQLGHLHQPRQISRQRLKYTAPLPFGIANQRSFLPNRRRRVHKITGNRSSAAYLGGVRPPDGEMAIVFTDVTRAASLWECNPGAMRDATLVHNEMLRRQLKKHHGYEVIFLRKSSGEGSFCMAFADPVDALEWCMDVQQVLLTAEWPEGILEHPGAAEEWGDVDDKYLPALTAFGWRACTETTNS